MDRPAENLVMQVVSYLVKDKHRELVEWCRRVRTDNVQVLVMPSDICRFSPETDMDGFLIQVLEIQRGFTAKGLVFEPVLGLTGFVELPYIICLHMDWQVVDECFL